MSDISSGTQNLNYTGRRPCAATGATAHPRANPGIATHLTPGRAACLRGPDGTILSDAASFRDGLPTCRPAIQPRQTCSAVSSRPARLPDLGSRPGASGARRREAPTPVDCTPAGLARHRRDDESASRPAEGARAGRHGRRASRRSTCSGWAAAACAPRCCGASTASREGVSGAVRARHDRRADDHRRRGAADARAHWFLVASKSGGTVEVASMERFFWSRVHAQLGDRGRAPVHRHHRPGHCARGAGDSRGYRETFLNPADIGGRFSALSLFGLVPTALIGVVTPVTCSGRRGRWRRLPAGDPPTPASMLGAFIGAAAADGRDKLTVVLPPSLASLGPVDRAAGRREHRQARQGRAAGRRRGARAAGRIRQRPRVRRHHHRSRRARRSRARRARGGRASRAASEHAARRARRGVLPVGVRDRGGRRGAGHQPVRRAERLGGQGEDQGAARRQSGRRRPPGGARADRFVREHRRLHHAFHGRLTGRGRQRGARSPAAARLRGVPLVPAPGQRHRPGCRRHSRRASVAGTGRKHLRRRARATCTPRGSITRVDRTRSSRSC